MTVDVIPIPLIVGPFLHNAQSIKGTMLGCRYHFFVDPQRELGLGIGREQMSSTACGNTEQFAEQNDRHDESHYPLPPLQQVRGMPAGAT